MKAHFLLSSEPLVISPGSPVVAICEEHVGNPECVYEAVVSNENCDELRTGNAITNCTTCIEFVLEELNELAENERRYVYAVATRKEAQEAA